MSGSSLRPKPPPSRCWLTITLSTGRPAAFAASDCTRVMICVPVQISQASGLTWTVALIGSIEACARNGSSKLASNLSPLASPLAMSPTDFATTPSFSLAARRCCQTSFVLSFAFGPSFHSILSAVEALLCGPHVIADHRDRILEHHDLAYARIFDRRAVVDLADLAAKDRAIGDRGDLHAGQDRVDAVDDLAIDLVRRVEPLQRLADDDEVLGVLHPDVLRRRLAL